jgi:hypothetical protein
MFCGEKVTLEIAKSEFGGYSVLSGSNGFVRERSYLLQEIIMIMTGRIIVNLKKFNSL